MVKFKAPAREIIIFNSEDVVAANGDREDTKGHDFIYTRLP